MNKRLSIIAAVAALGATAAHAELREDVPALDHVFPIVLENHNSYTSFESQGILDRASAPHLQVLSKT